ncbi:MAG: hypothetical protein IH792_04905 [Thaumarchaeota archaeon]|nr:hypothetical protein [Nitrososphaerota archaeon]
MGIKLLVPAIASILILGSIGMVPQSYSGNNVAVLPDDWDRGDDCAGAFQFTAPYDTAKDTPGFPGQLLTPGTTCSAGSLNTDPAVNDAFCIDNVNGAGVGSAAGIGGERDCHIHVPNFDDPFNTKLIRINVHWSGPVQPVTDNVKPSPGDTSEDCIRGPLVVVESVPGSQGFGHFYEDWTCHPNPDNERIWLTMDPSTNIIDVVVDFISFDRNAVGGDIIPLDTTMILVAGSQNTAAWMIPVIVSGIGFAIVIARKF